MLEIRSIDNLSNVVRMLIEPLSNLLRHQSLNIKIHNPIRKGSKILILKHLSSYDLSHFSSISKSEIAPSKGRETPIASMEKEVNREANSNVS